MKGFESPKQSTSEEVDSKEKENEKKSEGKVTIDDISQYFERWSRDMLSFQKTEEDPEARSENHRQRAKYEKYIDILANEEDAKPEDFEGMLKNLEDASNHSHFDYDHNGEFKETMNDDAINDREKHRDFTSLLTQKRYQEESDKEINIDNIKDLINELIKKETLDLKDDKDVQNYFQNVKDNLEKSSYELPIQYIENVIDHINFLEEGQLEEDALLLKNKYGEDYSETLKNLRISKRFLVDESN